DIDKRIAARWAGELDFKAIPFLDRHACSGNPIDATGARWPLSLNLLHKAMSLADQLKRLDDAPHVTFIDVPRVFLDIDRRNRIARVCVLASGDIRSDD